MIDTDKAGLLIAQELKAKGEKKFHTEKKRALKRMLSRWKDLLYEIGDEDNDIVMNDMVELYLEWEANYYK